VTQDLWCRLRLRLPCVVMCVCFPPPFATCSVRFVPRCFCARVYVCLLLLPRRNERLFPRGRAVIAVLQFCACDLSHHDAFFFSLVEAPTPVFVTPCCLGPTQGYLPPVYVFLCVRLCVFMFVFAANDACLFPGRPPHPYHSTSARQWLGWGIVRIGSFAVVVFVVVSARGCLRT
jgi:hypothetical protein